MDYLKDMASMCGKMAVPTRETSSKEFAMDMAFGRPTRKTQKPTKGTMPWTKR